MKDKCEETMIMQVQPLSDFAEHIQVIRFRVIELRVEVSTAAGTIQPTTN